MLLEVRAVGRKTPIDGKLELTEKSARRLAIVAEPIRVHLEERSGSGVLAQMSCDRCARSPDHPHAHHFVVSDLFRSLTAGATYAMELIGDELHISLAHPLEPLGPEGAR